MENNKLINYLFTILICIGLSQSENNCKIKMSNSKMSIFKLQDKLIYNEGIIDDIWKENSSPPYIFTLDEDIQYFYIMESNLADSKNKDKIVYKS